VIEILYHRLLLDKFRFCETVFLLYNLVICLFFCMIRQTFTRSPQVVPSPVGWQDSIFVAHSYRLQWPASRRNWHFRPQPHLRHPSFRFFRLTLPCSLVACDARLPVHLITQNYMQKVQSTNQVPINNCREEAVLKGENLGSWQSKAMASFTLLLPLVLPLHLPLSMFGHASFLHAWPL